jgi:Family of unknown function (DUF6084)
MPELNFQVEKAEAVPFAAAPMLTFKLRIDQSGEAMPIHAIVLRCQVRIDPAQRRYGATEKEKLLDLFDTPDRWGQTLRPLLWIHTTAVVRPFTSNIVADLPVPCSFDFNLAATKYFDALEDGEVPLSLLFSGTIFYEQEDAGLQVAQIPWEKEAAFRLPVRIWKEMMELYYPNSAWLCLRKDVFDQLYLYKSGHRIPTWEQVLESLLSPDPAASPSLAETGCESEACESRRRITDEFLGSE